jgi:DNA-directed RNA polymerase subunit RPC12/RpoP
MGIVSTIENALTGETEESADGSGSKGAYWCDDCGVRIRDVDLDAEGVERDETETPRCPDCGDAMRFERSHADGCAC